MSDEKATRKTDWIRQGNRRAIAIITGAVLVVGSVFGVQAFAGSDTYQHMQLASGYKSSWHGHKHFSDLSDSEIEDRVTRIVKHAAIEIEATAEQQEKIIALVTATAKDLKPVHARMHATGKEIHDLLLATTVDRAALEKLRAARLADAEQVSRDVVKTAADIADLLSPEQRKILDERIQQFRHMRRGWHRGYPFVRRLTRRLEDLQKGVERIGAGDLSARVDVQGRDEVADLAASFNDATEQIENLIGAHRLLLANASHELRTPLSRIRMGVELLQEGGDSNRRAALQQDIAELDELIDEILLMSRLDAGSHADLAQDIDLVALAAEECARYPACTLSGTAPNITGDPRLLRRLVRNLLENAHNHGVAPVEVEISSTADRASLTVRDAGDGIADADRDKVFQPFYRAADRQNVRGYGLGLPLARQIAEAHGGSVSLLPRSEARSAVRVAIPLPKTG